MPRWVRIFYATVWIEPNKDYIKFLFGGRPCNFHMMVSCVMFGLTNNEHNRSRSDRLWYGFSLSNPEKEDFQTRVIRSGRNSKPDVRIICVKGGGSKNSPLGGREL